MDKAELEAVVAEVLKRLESVPTGPVRAPSDGFVFTDLDACVKAAAEAQEEFQALGLAKRRAIIDAMRKTAIQNAEPLARMAREETGMGRFEDKVKKNLVVATKTPGVECLETRAYTGDDGLTLVEWAPFGVVAAIIPSTNPTATVINNSISILSAGNSVVFSPHPAAVKCSREAMRLLNEAIVANGGPRNLITTADPASQEMTKSLLAHPGVSVNLVTGGPAIVKVAMTVGKTCKTIAAGPGNPPVVVDETADIEKAAKGVVSGCSFDNNVLCTAEKEVIVVEAVHARFLEALRRAPRAFELTGSNIDAVTKKIIIEGGRGCKDPKLDRKFVGKDASVIAAGCGISVPSDVRLLWADVPNDHPFVWTEQLMPVLPITKVKCVDAAIDLAYHAEGYNHHTSSMYSMDVGNLTKMARKMACSIFVKNAPNYFGLGMGEGYASMSIGTPTGDGLTRATHFVRPLHCSLVGFFRIA
ncbi:MAG: aldehyde dehydrogenase EutE [Elusimicrobia bacterium]|nr:aldehyde dehydrogenase EutE [Elusimicrobiota bacterium]